jgi:hypothetical protein
MWKYAVFPFMDKGAGAIRVQQQYILKEILTMENNVRNIQLPIIEDGYCYGFKNGVWYKWKGDFNAYVGNKQKEINNGKYGFAKVKGRPCVFNEKGLDILLK